MKFLITGIAGFVGSTIAEKLISNGHDVIGIDNMSYGYESRLNTIRNKCEIIYDDVRDISKYLTNKSFQKINFIIHCAAIAPLPENQKDIYNCLDHNVSMCGAIADFATTIGIKNIIFFSSGAIYEGSGNKPAIETDSVSPQLIYPLSKFLGEQVFKAITLTYGINVVAIRLFNLYGPKQDYARKQPPLIGYLIKSILKNEPITLYASPEAKRDYIFIDDLYNLVIAISNKIKNEKKGYFDIVNAGSGKTYSVFDIYKILASISNSSYMYKTGEKSSFWNKYPEIFQKIFPLSKEILLKEVDKIAIANIDKAKTKYNWSSSISMEKGLENCFIFAKGVVK